MFKTTSEWNKYLSKRDTSDNKRREMGCQRDRHQSWSGIPMGSTRMLLRWSAVLLAVLLSAAAQEINFGKKVKCYLQDGTVVCPGCNSRAGLLCPRITSNMESCNTNPEFPSNTKPPPTTHISEDEPMKDTQDSDTKNTTHETIPFGDIPQEEIEYWSKMARENLQFRLFLFRILRPYGIRRRWARQVEEEDDTCEWNGDCPCPLICCKRGDGCPKRCVKGILLPPPWG